MAFLLLFDPKHDKSLDLVFAILAKVPTVIPLVPQRMSVNP